MDCQSWRGSAWQVRPVDGIHVRMGLMSSSVSLMRFGVGRAIVLQVSRSIDVRQAQSPPSIPKLPLAFAPAAIVNHIGQYGTLSLEQSMLD